MIRIHWLQGTVQGSKTVNVISYLEGYFGPGVHGRGLHGYEVGILYPFGVRLAYDLSTEAGERHGGRSMIAIPGQACDFLGWESLWGLVRLLALEDFNATRIDLAFDDLERVILPLTLSAWQSTGRLKVLGFRKWASHQERNKGVLSLDEWCCGSRGENGTGSYLRVYDKALESGGELDSIRWELELSGKKACLCFNSLASEGVFPGRRIAGYIRGVMRFLDMETQKEPEWMECLLRGIEGSMISLPGTCSDVEKKKSWVTRCVLPTLALIGASMVPADAEKEDIHLASVGWLGGELTARQVKLSMQDRMIAKKHYQENKCPF